MAAASDCPLQEDERFAFGTNWRKFLGLVDDERIAAAESSLRRMLGREHLGGAGFLDAGSGSGLMSLAARRMGARVLSFDVDPQSVQCTRELKGRFFPGDPDWEISEASVLDANFLASVGSFDFVYSWGVLHHTGAIWQAIENLVPVVAPGGRLCLAIYNDQGPLSRRWRRIKQLYARLPQALRPVLVFAVVLAGAGRRLAATLLASLVRLVTLRNPLVPWAVWWQDLRQRDARGMHWWRDEVDWVGGWPFEVAKPEKVFRFLRDRGFRLEEMTTCGGGHGCNEFVFLKSEG